MPFTLSNINIFYAIGCSFLQFLFFYTNKYGIILMYDL